MHLSTIITLMFIAILISLEFIRYGIRCVTAPITAVLSYVLVYVALFEIYMTYGGYILIQSHYSEIFLANASFVTMILVFGCATGYLAAYFFPVKISFYNRTSPKFIFSKRLPYILLCVSLSSALYMYFSEQIRLNSDNPVAQVNAGYILQAIDLAIPAIVILYFIDLSRGRVSHETIILCFLFGFLYMIVGARYRLFCLLLGVGSTWFLGNPKIYKITLMLCILMFVIPAAGALALIRNYRSGVNLDMLSGATLPDMVSRGFNEASSTVALGAVVDVVPSVMSYVGLAPVWVTITQPIPRMLWPGKPVPDYLLVVPMSMGRGAEFFGLALPFSGEMYLMGGYWVVFVAAAVVFFFIQRTFSHALATGNIPLAAGLFLFLPTLLSRGYLAQAVTSFAFLVLPIVLIARHELKAQLRRIARLDPRSGHNWRRI